MVTQSTTKKRYLFSIDIPQRLLQQIDKRAKEERRKRAQMIRVLLERALSQKEGVTA